MGDDGNLFNTFSFGNWDSKKKEEELERENRRRRREHIKKLKNKLRKEKERQKALGPLGGGDLESIMAALAAAGVDLNGLNGAGGDNDWNESDDEVLKEIIPLVHRSDHSHGHGGSHGHGANGYDDEHRPSSGFNFNRKFQYDKF